MLNVRLLMLTRPFNTSLQRGADVTVGTSYVSAEFKVTSLSTAGHTPRVTASRPEAQSVRKWAL